MNRLTDGKVVALAKKYYPVWDQRLHGFAGAIQDAHRELNAVQPMEDSEMAETTDPREMRKRITDIASGGGRIDGKDSDHHRGMAALLAARALDRGDREGLSGEDVMTIIAYHALLNYEATLDNLMSEATSQRKHHGRP